MPALAKVVISKVPEVLNVCILYPPEEDVEPPVAVTFTPGLVPMYLGIRRFAPHVTQPLAD
jgi:hypothetical protein